MVGPVPYGQFIGELVNIALILGVALWFFFVRPWKIRGKVRRGELKEIESRPKVKEARLTGVMWLALAVCSLMILLDQVEFFGDSIIPTAAVIAVAIIVFAIVIRAKRRVASGNST